MSFPTNITTRLDLLRTMAKEHYFDDGTPTAITEEAIQQSEKFLTQLMAENAAVLNDLALTCSQGEYIWFEIGHSTLPRAILMWMYPNGSVRFVGFQPEISLEPTEWDQAIDMIITTMYSDLIEKMLRLRFDQKMLTI
jgi:hypothetical protein